jgi:6-phosphogluconolactonase
MRNATTPRRRILALGLAGIAGLVLSGGNPTMAQTTPDTVVYVSNAGSRDVVVLSMNRTSGALIEIQRVAVPGAEKSPSSLPMAMSPDKRFLYAQLRGEPYPVSTFAVDKATGRLKYLSSTPLVDQMAYLNTDRTGKYLLGASYVGAKLAVYPTDGQGYVEPKATQILDTKPKAHCVIIDSGNTHLYVPVLGGDEVLEMNFDPAKGTVTPNGAGRIATKTGAGPRHLTFHPGGTFAYLMNETSATMGAYAIDGTGTLKELQTVKTADYKAQPAASDIHVTPDGKFVYGAERTTSTLIGYKIDARKGTLSPIGHFPTEKTPRGFAIDPRGRFLLSVGLDSASMTVYAIDPATGHLEPVGRYPMGTQPNWIEIVDLK